MSQWRIGKVAQVDRVRRVVRGQLEHDYSSGEPPPQFEAYYHGDPPWPLSQVRLAQVGSGIWECFGPIGQRDVVLHEDFGAYADVSNAQQHFDHVWERHRGFADGSINVSAGTTGRGQATLITAATTAHYLNIRRLGYEVPLVPADTAIWFSALSSIVAPDYIAQVGLVDTGGSDYVFAAGDIFVGFRSDSTIASGNWHFVGARDATTYASIDTGVVPLGGAGSLEIVDVVIAPPSAGEGTWAAGWITQIPANPYIDLIPTVAGPFVIEDAQLPLGGPSDGSLGPILGIYPQANSSVLMVLDWAHLEVIAPVVHPTQDLILGQSGLLF